MAWDRDRSWAGETSTPIAGGFQATQQVCHRHSEYVVTRQFITGLAGRPNFAILWRQHPPNRPKIDYAKFIFFPGNLAKFIFFPGNLIVCI
jgi:hypothetical protein